MGIEAVARTENEREVLRRVYQRHYEDLLERDDAAFERLSEAGDRLAVLRDELADAQDEFEEARRNLTEIRVQIEALEELARSQGVTLVEPE